MNKDIKVARVMDNQIVEIINAPMCPFYIRRKNSSFETWVLSRTIDTTRPNSRILRKLLGLKRPDTLEVAMKANCITITDGFGLKKRVKISPTAIFYSKMIY